MVLLQGLIRLMIPILICGGAGILVAWSTTNNPAVAEAISTSCTALGVVPGCLWANNYTERKWYK